MHRGNVKSVAARPPTPVRRSELPRLDLLRSFEAAARTLSFTKAAAELALTQSAVSRQIQQIEDGLGTPLFERHHRSLSLTDAGLVLHRAVVDSLERLRDATARLKALGATRRIAVTCTPGFASFWLIPRLAKFTESHPSVDVRISATLDVLDLERAGIDVAVRFVPVKARMGAALFEETVLPVCAPALASDSQRPLRKPADLAHHTLLTIDMPQGVELTADWEPWLKVMRLTTPRMKNTLRFTLYTDAVAAAVAGQGVVIGRLPLLNELLRDGRLVAPFKGAASRRGYFIDTNARGRHDADAQDFIRWLNAEAEGAGEEAT